MLDMPELVNPKNLKNPFTVLAFDFGTQRIGVAVGQSVTKSASPMAVLTVKSRQERLMAIAPLVQEWQPQLFIVGLPYYPDGTAHEVTALATKFARQISEHFRLPFVMVDERYTSVEAQQAIRSSNLAKSCQSGNSSANRVDAYAAALIAEQYFNQSDQS